MISKTYLRNPFVKGALPPFPFAELILVTPEWVWSVSILMYTSDRKSLNGLKWNEYLICAFKRNRGSLRHDYHFHCWQMLPCFARLNTICLTGRRSIGRFNFAFDWSHFLFNTVQRGVYYTHHPFLALIGAPQFGLFRIDFQKTFLMQGCWKIPTSLRVFKFIPYSVDPLSSHIEAFSRL